MASHDEDTLLQSDTESYSDGGEEQHFSQLEDDIQNETASPSLIPSPIYPSQDENTRLNADANEYQPRQYITPAVYVGRTFDQQEFVDCLAALRQVNLLVLEGKREFTPETKSTPSTQYFFFVAMRTPLTSVYGWEAIINHIRTHIKQDHLPSERDEDISKMIHDHCEQLAFGDPVLENQPVRTAMLNFISGKYLGTNIQAHYMN